jgi:hypothetical protein
MIVSNLTNEQQDVMSSKLEVSCRAATPTAG